VGSYEVELAWRSEGACDGVSPPVERLAFRLDVDRRHSDELRATDLATDHPRPLDAVGTDGAVILVVPQAEIPGWTSVTMKLRVRATGATLAGSAEYELDEPHLRHCAYNATLRGTKR
jgi:hypothetical protein